MKNNGAARAVWKSLTCGAQVNIDESLTCVPTEGSQVASEPFSLGMPNQGDGQLGWNTVGLATDINRIFGGSSDAVLGTDASPLILQFVMNNGPTVDKLTHANVFFELSLYDSMTSVDDRAPTDYVFSPYCETACAPDYGAAREIPMICQQDVPPAGCPPIASAPHHSSIAVGAHAYLDKDPCHCTDPVLSSATNEHLAVFDGYKWWTLPASFTGEGDFVMRSQANIVRMTITSTMFKVEMTAEEPEPDEYSWCEIPRDYLGPFNRLHMGFGQACLIDSGSWACANEPTGERRYKCIKGNLGAGRPAFDNVTLYGGEGHTLPAPIGACCGTGGGCTDGLTDYECETEQGGVWQGPNTICLGTLCCREPFADADGDNDVDAEDFAVFQRCLTLGGGNVPAGCGCFDVGPDGFPDGDIDLDDFLAFLDCGSGPSVAFVSADHPNCPPSIEATTWFYEDWESYASGEETGVAWPIQSGAGMAFFLEGGIYGPKCMGGAKSGIRRNYHDLLPHIQAAGGGAGKTSVNGTDEAPLVFEAAYTLKSPIDTARSQDFFWDLAKGMDSAPRRVSGIGTPHNVLAFGAFTAYNGLPGVGYREGLMYYDGQNWFHHQTTLRHAAGWNFLTVVIRATTVHITYYDEALSNGIQHLTVPRAYTGDFSTMGINADTCVARVNGSDGYKLSGGVFLPQ
ncbi:MAG: hypothetical protein HY718_09475 [Planctomycetes bacterium]|nr:hypothetical protein [Planctomycetota bacterium]